MSQHLPSIETKNNHLEFWSGTDIIARRLNDYTKIPTVVQAHVQFVWCLAATKSSYSGKQDCICGFNWHLVIWIFFCGQLFMLYVFIYWRGIKYCGFFFRGKRKLTGEWKKLRDWNRVDANAISSFRSGKHDMQIFLSLFLQSSLCSLCKR